MYLCADRSAILVYPDDCLIDCSHDGLNYRRSGIATFVVELVVRNYTPVSIVLHSCLDTYVLELLRPVQLAPD